MTLEELYRELIFRGYTSSQAAEALSSISGGTYTGLGTGEKTNIFESPERGFTFPNGSPGNNYDSSGLQLPATIPLDIAATANASSTIDAAANAGKASRFKGLKDLYARIKGGGPIISGDFKLPSMKGFLEGAKTFRDAPITEGGPSLGNTAAAIGGIVQGAKAIGNLSQADAAQNDYEQLAKDIRLEVASNPLAMSGLSMADKKRIRQIKSGTEVNNVGNVASSVAKGLPKILLNTAIGGVTGGPLGAIIQGVGTAVNKGAEGYTAGMNEGSARLQDLYDRLANSSQEYNRMKRPQNLYGAGLQSRYMDQLW